MPHNVDLRPLMNSNRCLNRKLNGVCHLLMLKTMKKSPFRIFHNFSKMSDTLRIKNEHIFQR